MCMMKEREIAQIAYSQSLKQIFLASFLIHTSPGGVGGVDTVSSSDAMLLGSGLEPRSV